MSDYMLTARYEPKMTKKREARICEALDKSGVRWGIGNTPDFCGEIDGQTFPIYFSDVDWMCEDEDKNTELEISMRDRGGLSPVKDRADRLASELRACGMIVSIREIKEEAAS
jgi:hypothetical protein